jgi:ribosomal protein S12 methylthiotransferase
MRLQAQISAERQQLFLGKTLKVLAESIDKKGKVVWGRSYREAPEVDGLVGTYYKTLHLKSKNDGNAKLKRNIKSGDFIYSKITDTAEHDLFGEILDESLVNETN